MKKFNEYLKIVESKSAKDFNLNEGDKVFTILGPQAGKDKYYGIVQTPILYQYPDYVCSVTFYDINTNKRVGITDEYAIDYLHRLDGQKIYYSQLKQNEKLDKPGKEDIDINNDGEVNKSDFYLLNRRRKRKKAIKENLENSLPAKAEQIYFMFNTLTSLYDEGYLNEDLSLRDKYDLEDVNDNAVEFGNQTFGSMEEFINFINSCKNIINNTQTVNNITESYNIMSLIVPKKSEWFKVNDSNNEYYAFKFLGNVYAIQQDNLQFIINNIGKYIKFKTQESVNRFKLIMFPELLNKLNEYHLNRNDEEIETIENGFKVTNGKGLTGTVVSINGDEATVLVDYENGPVKPYTTSININELESINEIFGFSKKEKDLKQLQIDIDNAKKEIDQADFSGFFKETSQNPTNEELKKLSNIILYNVKYKIPTFLKLFPDIETNLSKDKPNAVSCIYDYNGKDLHGITLSSLSRYLKDNYYDKIDDNTKNILKKHLNFLLKKQMNENFNNTFIIVNKEESKFLSVKDNKPFQTDNINFAYTFSSQEEASLYKEQIEKIIPTFFDNILEYIEPLSNWYNKTL